MDSAGDEDAGQPPDGVFGIVDGPITRTADGDPWLGFNGGILGTIAGP